MKRKWSPLRPGLVAAVVVVVLLAVAISGDWVMLVPAVLALAAAGGLARSLRMTGRE